MVFSKFEGLPPIKHEIPFPYHWIIELVTPSSLQA